MIAYLANYEKTGVKKTDLASGNSTPHAQRVQSQRPLEPGDCCHYWLARQGDLSRGREGREAIRC